MDEALSAGTVSTQSCAVQHKHKGEQEHGCAGTGSQKCVRETTLATAANPMQISLFSLHPCLHTHSLHAHAQVINPIFFARQLLSPRISHLGFLQFSDENLSFLAAEDFVNPSLSCLAFSQNPRIAGVGKQSRSPT